MTNLYIIACFSGHVSGTDVDSNRPGKRRIRKILYGADCAAIWNNLWQKNSGSSLFCNRFAGGRVQALQIFSSRKAW